MQHLKIMAIALLMAAAGCTKEGPQGEAGKDGNANVVGTNTVTISNWTAAGNGWETTLSAPGITQTIVDKGIVQVFIQYDNQWWALPDLNGINATQYGFSVGTVHLLNADNDGLATPYPATMTFRIVIIAPSQIAANPNTDWTDYEQVTEALDL